MKIGNLIKWAIATGLVVLSFLNASWLAPEPPGGLSLIAAHSGDNDGCATLESTRRALIDAGGGVVIETDSAKGCMTAEMSLAQFPRYHFILKVSDAEKALAIFGRLKRPIDERYGFLGDAAAIATIRAKAPHSWAWTIAEGRSCFADYVTRGWLGLVPASCKGGTILVPLDQKWKVAGWPKRFQARMKTSGTRVILTAPGIPADSIPGLTQLEQIPQVPRAYTGMLWLEDAALIGASIRR